MPALRTVLGTTALVAVSLFAVGAPAVHAAAPALPAGDALYTISCDGETTEPLQLFSLDSATGASTPIGSGYAEGNCGYDPAWDPTTGIAYGLSQSDDGMSLVTVDLVTGDMVLVGYLDYEGDGFSEGSLTIGLDGTAWFLDEGGASLYTVDLATAELDFVGAVDGLVEPYAWGFATDPTTGELYLVDDDGAIYHIDPVGLVATLVGTAPLPDGIVAFYGLTIDTAGTAWLVSFDNSGATSGLWSTPLASPGAPEFSGDLIDVSDDDPYYSFVVFSTWAVAPPAPQLAATGVDVTPIAAGAGMLALAGLVLVASRRRAAA